MNKKRNIPNKIVDHYVNILNKLVPHCIVKVATPQYSRNYMSHYVCLLFSTPATMIVRMHGVDINTIYKFTRTVEYFK